MTNDSIWLAVRALLIACLLTFVLPMQGRAAPLTMTFVNDDTTYAPTDAWFLFSYTGSADDEFEATVLGNGPKSGAMVFTAGAGPSAGSYFSESYSITDLAMGIEITKAPSSRIYVSLGQPLDAKESPQHPGAPFSSFGVPSSTAGTADPNWNVRWDFFEITLSNPRAASDYGDLSVINQFAIPLRVELYSSATELTQDNLLQTAESASNPLMLRANLEALANANLQNSNRNPVPGNWSVETPSTPGATNPYPSTFLRIVGPASGGANPEWIGPFPSMNPYAEHLASVSTSTTLQGSTAVKDTLLQTYDMTTTAALSLSPPNEVIGLDVEGTVDTQVWNTITHTWDPPTNDGKTYRMEIALDSDVGEPTADYHLSNALYGSAWQGNSGISYWIESTPAAGFVEFSQGEFLASVSSNAKMAEQTVNQWMQNLFVGYNFGLVGNTQTVSNLPGGHPLIGVSLNDMGSAGWTEIKRLIDEGTLSTSDVPFFTLTDSLGRPLYNQWARIVFTSSQTAYGMQYSDMFQPLLALYTYQSPFLDNVYQPTDHDVLAWRVTIVPEPGPVGSLAAVATVLAIRRTRSRRA